MFSIFISLVFQFFINRISGVMVRVLNSIEVDSVFEPRSCQSNDYKIGICCFSTKHAALRKKSRDWLSRNQDNVFECGDMSIQINVQQNIYMNFKFITILTCDNSVSKAVESPYNTDVPVTLIIWIIQQQKGILYKYSMWLWSIYKNIFSRYLELHGSVILPDTNGRGQYNTSMQFKVPRENVLVYWPQSHQIFVILYFNSKTISNVKKSHTRLYFLVGMASEARIEKITGSRHRAI
jgi:hypothetical protein